MTITFFTEPFSHWCIKAEKILRYKKLPYDARRVGYHDKRELLAATGQDYVPALVVDGRVVTWPDVPDELERLAPEPTIYPDGARGLARMVESWAHWRLEDVTWLWVVPDMPATFTDPMERWVFEEIQFIKRGPLEAIRARRAALGAELARNVRWIEEQLAERPYFFGGEPSVADFAAYGALALVRYAGHDLPEEFARTRAWLDRIAAI